MILTPTVFFVILAIGIAIGYIIANSVIVKASDFGIHKSEVVKGAYDDNAGTGYVPVTKEGDICLDPPDEKSVNALLALDPDRQLLLRERVGDGLGARKWHKVMYNPGP